jgi:hypothetical protein
MINKTLLIQFSMKVILSSISLMSVCHAEATTNGRGVYLGLFGGGGSLSNTSIEQTGISFGKDGKANTNVAAQGTSGNTGASIGGAHVGYEFDGWNLGGKESGWALNPTAEIEGYYLGSNPSAYAVNPLATFKHDFSIQMPIDAGVFLVNTIFSFKTPYTNNITPYFGGGIGGATLSVSGASSEQLTPAETGLNHFNTNPNASGSAFAASAKAGLRAEVYNHFSLFAEYRYLFINSSSYSFGNTNGASQGYPNHNVTTPWNVNLGSQNYNMAVAGFEYSF